MSALRGGLWTQTDELLASLIETTSAGHRLAYAIAGGKEDWPVVRVSRPGEVEDTEPEPESKFATVHELKAFMMRTGG